MLFDLLLKCCIRPSCLRGVKSHRAAPLNEAMQIDVRANSHEQMFTAMIVDGRNNSTVESYQTVTALSVIIQTQQRRDRARMKRAITSAIYEYKNVKAFVTSSDQSNE